MAKQETREALVKSFFSIYKEKPVNRISIKEVTDRAGYHRSTFYEYFSDIYDLLEQEEREIFRLQSELILEPVQKGTISLDSEKTLDSLRKLFEIKGEEVMILIGDNGDASFRRTLQDRIRNIIMTEKLRKGDHRSEYLAEFISGGALSTYERAYREEADVEEVMKLVYPVVSKLLK